MRRLCSTIGMMVLVCSCNPFESKMTAICEEVIKARLKSPSSYARIEITEYRSDVSIAEYRDAELTRLLRDQPSKYPAVNEANAELRRRLLQTVADLERQHSQPVTYRKHISYDAANAFGGLLRSSAICVYTSPTGSESDIDPFDVRIDGLNAIEWVAERVKQSQ